MLSEWLDKGRGVCPREEAETNPGLGYHEGGSGRGAKSPNLGAGTRVEARRAGPGPPWEAGAEEDKVGPDEMPEVRHLWVSLAGKEIQGTVQVPAVVICLPWKIAPGAGWSLQVGALQEP